MWISKEKKRANEKRRKVTKVLASLSFFLDFLFNYLFLGEEVTCVMKEQHPNVEFDVEQEYELVWRSESQLNEKVIPNTGEQVRAKKKKKKKRKKEKKKKKKKKKV